jgi:hypothetical protein
MREMPDFNLFNLDFSNLAKLMSKGRVDTVYYKMYRVADKLTKEDFQRFKLEVLAKSDKFKDTSEFALTLSNFFNERIEFHMNEMKKLLEMSMKNQSKEK